MQELHPQVVITDWLMPEIDGAELCRTLRQSEWGHDVYVLMLTAQDGVNDLMEAFEAGVDDYISKPINPRVLLARLKAAARYVRLRDAWRTSHQQLRQSVSELARSNRQLQEAALLDELTGLPNRRAGQTRLSQAWSAARRYGSSLAVVLLDVDHFKDINDRLGHAAGDAVLQAVATVLRQELRHEDSVCRWGGEEFLFVMPNVDAQGVVTAAERIRAALEKRPVLGDDMGNLNVTASLGCAVIDSDLEDMNQLLQRADQALYAAKRDGRNRVNCWAATI
jgi:diguanylate cyclase (GGDEF)-like protein